jgi:hypothetical protein
LFIIIKDENDRISLSQLLHHPCIKPRVDFFKKSISLQIPPLPYLSSSSLDFFGNNDDSSIIDNNSLPKIKTPLYVYTMAAKYLQSKMESSPYLTSSLTSLHKKSFSSPTSTSSFSSTYFSNDFNSPSNSSLNSQSSFLPSLNSSPSGDGISSSSSYIDRNNGFYSLLSVFNQSSLTPDGVQYHKDINRNKKKLRQSQKDPLTDGNISKSPNNSNYSNISNNINNDNIKSSYLIKNFTDYNSEKFGDSTVFRTIHGSTTTEHISKKLMIKINPLKQSHKYDDLKRKRRFNFHLPSSIFVDTPENKTQSVLGTFSKIGTSDDENSKIIKKFRKSQINSNSTVPSIRHVTLLPMNNSETTSSIVKTGFFSLFFFFFFFF